MNDSMCGVNNKENQHVFTPLILKIGKYREALLSLRHEKVKTCP